jgi:hypothetical protein
MAMAALGTFLAAMTAGCGSSGRLANPGDSGGSGSSATSSPPSPSAAPMAPPVANPLSVQKFLDHPCDLLTTSRAEALGATKLGEPSNARDPHGAGSTCNWHDSDAVATFSAGIVPGDRNGLDDIYRANQDPDYDAYFVPTTIKEAYSGGGVEV